MVGSRGHSSGEVVPRRRARLAYARIVTQSAAEPFDQPAYAHFSAEASLATRASMTETW